MLASQKYAEVAGMDAPPPAEALSTLEAVLQGRLRGTAERARIMSAFECANGCAKLATLTADEAARTVRPAMWPGLP